VHHRGEGRPGPQPPEQGPFAAGARPPSTPSCTRPATAAECRISRLKRNRAVATGYDKLAVRYEATVHIAAISEWLRPGFPDTP